MAVNLGRSIYDILERELFPYVEKPMRYIGGELNTVKKNPEEISMHMVLAFPDVYEIGMSHTGSQILYHVVNSNKNWAMSRSYHPWLDAEKIMREKSIPLYTYEYFTPVKNADVIGFSQQYELLYGNFVNMLELADVPVYSKERAESDPFVVSGGPCITNPEPIADFCDAIIIGDGEEALPSLLNVLEDGKSRGLTRSEKLKKLSDIEGVYVPSIFNVESVDGFLIPKNPYGEDQFKPAKIHEFKSEYSPKKPMVPLMETVHNRLAVEVMRGCTRGCRFCSAGYFYRPIREKSVDDVMEQIINGVEGSGWSSVGLLSLSTADYSSFNTLMDEISDYRKKRHFKVTLPSTRLDALDQDEIGKLNELSPSTSFTIAPEAGSQRLRNVINKDFSTETIIETVKLLMNNNIQTLKLYFMIGLPTESYEDLDEMIKLISEISKIVRATSKKRKINVSMSPFSPKANTPFQWSEVMPIDELMNRGRYVKTALRDLKNVRASYREAGVTWLETLLARGDRTLGRVIRDAQSSGARFDSWEDCFNLDRWITATEKCGVDPHIFTKAIPLESALPWDAVSTGVTKRFLRKELEKSLSKSVTKNCRDGFCSVCGVCTSENQLKNMIAMSSNASEIDKSEDKSQKESSKHKFGSYESNTKFYTYRITYKRGRSLRFVSHMTIVDIFHAAVKAAGINVKYSEGFRPAPRLSFGPPLGLGVCGNAEMFDITTLDEIEITNDLLKKWLPDGLEILSSEPVVGKVASLNSSIIAADYLFVPISDVDSSILSEVVERVLNSEKIEFSIEKKGKVTVKDIKQLVSRINLTEFEGKSAISARLSMLPGKSLRPADFIKCMFKNLRFYDFVTYRTECIIKKI